MYAASNSTSLGLGPSTGCVAAPKFPDVTAKFLLGASGTASRRQVCMQALVLAFCLGKSTAEMTPIWSCSQHSPGSMDIKICFVEHQGRKPGLWMLPLYKCIKPEMQPWRHAHSLVFTANFKVITTLFICQIQRAKVCRCFIFIPSYLILYFQHDTNHRLTPGYKP